MLPNSILQGKSNRAILIQTSEPVAVYGMFKWNDGAMSEGFYVYPTKFLGQNYIAVTGEPTDLSFLTILSVADNTHVYVTPTNDVYCKGCYEHGGSSISISMDKLQAVQLVSLKDLSGSTIHSSKPVAVLSGNQCTPFNCNYLVEYLVPNTACGREFIVPPFNGTSMRLKIFATGDRTNISISSATTTNISEIINTFIEKKFGAKEPYAIRSDKPVCVYMLLVMGTKPMLTAIPSLDQYVDDAVITVPMIASYANFLSIAIKTTSLSQLRFDNRTLSPSNLKTINFDGVQYSTFWIHLDRKRFAPQQRLKGSSKADVFCAIAHGHWDYQGEDHTYGYPVARGLYIIN